MRFTQNNRVNGVKASDGLNLKITIKLYKWCVHVTQQCLLTFKRKSPHNVMVININQSAKCEKFFSGVSFLQIFSYVFEYLVVTSIFAVHRLR